MDVDVGGEGFGVGGGDEVLLSPRQCYAVNLLIRGVEDADCPKAIALVVGALPVG